MNDLKRWITLVETEDASWVPAYRGVPPNANKISTTYGLFFSNSRHVAASYAKATGGFAGNPGQVMEVLLDLSAALDWTTSVAERFQRYVGDWYIAAHNGEDKIPSAARKALSRYNAAWQTRITMPEAVGQLMREHPNRLGHHEIDPLMGFVRAYTNDYQRDVIIRDHETGGGMKDGTKEYIVFALKRIKVV